MDLTFFLMAGGVAEKQGIITRLGAEGVTLLRYDFVMIHVQSHGKLG